MTKALLSRRQALVTAGALAGAAITPRTYAQAKGPGLEFLVLGDWGRDGAAHQRDVATAMGRRAAQVGARFIMTVGDNFYDNGVTSAEDPQWRTSFEEIYTAPALQAPWFAALGNHDYRGAPQAQLDYALTSPRWRLPSRYYKVEGAAFGASHVDLFVLDTSPLVNSYRTKVDSQIARNVAGQDVAAQLAWLDRELAASRAPWRLVLGHHPVFSGGSSHGDTPEMIALVEPILKRHGVQAYIAGHDHDLQYIVRDGMHLVQSGAGSEVRPVRSVEGTGFCLSRSGFTRLRCEPRGLLVEYLDYTGRPVFETRIAQGMVAA